MKDYKFFCFDGKVKFFKIDFDRFTDHHANYYSPEGVLLPFGEADLPPKPEYHLKIPSQLSNMIKFAEQLSAGRSFLRVDFYEVNDKVYFGELTFYPAGGMGDFTPGEWNLTLGDMIHLPKQSKI